MVTGPQFVLCKKATCFVYMHNGRLFFFSEDKMSVVCIHVTTPNTVLSLTINNLYVLLQFLHMQHASQIFQPGLFGLCKGKVYTLYRRRKLTEQKDKIGTSSGVMITLAKGKYAWSGSVQHCPNLVCSSTKSKKCDSTPS